MKKIFALVLGAITAVLFVSCQDKKNTTPDSDSPVLKANYSLTLSVCDAAADQQDVVKTVVNYKDNQGNPRTEEFLEYTEEMTLMSPINYSLPYKDTITITQTLKEDVSLTKDQYDLGLDYSITVNSVDDNDGVFGTKTVEAKSVHYTVRKENMALAFPKEISFEISVDAKGSVAITTTN